jgi:hypothetical protein
MLLLIFLSACTPTVHLVTDKPIEINMTVTIEIKIAVEKELDKLLSDESGLF